MNYCEKFSSTHCSKLVDLSIRFREYPAEMKATCNWIKHRCLWTSGQEHILHKKLTFRVCRLSSPVVICCCKHARISLLLIFFLSLSLVLSFCLKCLYLLSLFATLPFFDILLFSPFLLSAVFQLDYDYLFCSFLNSFERRERERERKNGICHSILLYIYNCIQ